MVIFHSYVSLPEGIHVGPYPRFQNRLCLDRFEHELVIFHTCHAHVHVIAALSSAAYSRGYAAFRMEDYIFHLGHAVLEEYVKK
jgi:hypothetical protein